MKVISFYVSGQQIQKHCKKKISSNNTGIKSQAISLLGLQWDASKDCINFPVKNFDSPIESLIERKVLSIASQLFDPLGLVLPVCILARLFIAELWDENLAGTSLTPCESERLENIEHELNIASRFQFPR